MNRRSLFKYLAVIPALDLATLRNRLAEDADRDGFPINYTKPVANSAFQAVENWFTQPAVQAAVSNAINLATAPLVLTPAQKKAVVRRWLDWKARST